MHADEPNAIRVAIVIMELQPWLGAICEHLQREGVATVTTVADSQPLALAGGRKIRGIGAHS